MCRPCRWWFIHGTASPDPPDRRPIPSIQRLVEAVFRSQARKQARPLSSRSRPKGRACALQELQQQRQLWQALCRASQDGRVSAVRGCQLRLLVIFNARWLRICTIRGIDPNLQAQTAKLVVCTGLVGTSQHSDQNRDFSRTHICPITAKAKPTRCSERLPPFSVLKAA